MTGLAIPLCNGKMKEGEKTSGYPLCGMCFMLRDNIDEKEREKNV